MLHLFMPNEHFYIVDFLASNRPNHRQLIVRERRRFVGQEEPVALRPIAGWRGSRPISKHSFGGGIEDEKVPIFVRYDDSVAHVRQNRAKDLIGSR